MHEFHLDITFSWYDIFAIISWILVFASSFRYMYSIIKGKTKPNVVGWLLYQIATLCVLVSSYDLGAMSTIVASFAYAINQLIIIWLAFRYGYAKMNRVEWIFFGVSILSLIVWIFLDHSLYLLLINTFIDAMGALAIFVKLYKHPESEDTIAWFIAMISWMFSVLAVQEASVTELVYPYYLLISNAAIWMLCFRKKPKHRFEKLFNILGRITWKDWRH